MGNMRFKVGDRVRIKSFDWYNENKSKSHGTVACGGKYFDYDMREWCGKTMTIIEACQTCYLMEEDGFKDLWTDEMIEGLAEEENTLSKNAKLVSERFAEYVNPSEVKYAQDTITKMLLQGANIPNEYILKDENGNVINATKIVLEKKKKEYPKTYEECCYVLGFENTELVFEDDYRDINPPKEQWKRLGLMNQLNKLLICRDAYWKIVGDWKPKFNSDCLTPKYIMTVDNDRLIKSWTSQKQYILAFPTEEMRDAFYENFKELIETVKELL